MFWVGLCVSGFLGACIGLWMEGFIDWVRCHSVGIPDAREAAVCPTFAGVHSWAHIPWEHLRTTQANYFFTWCAFLGGTCLFVATWSQFWFIDQRAFAWVWNTAFLLGLLFIALLDARWRILPVEPLIAAAVIFGFGRYALGASLWSILLGAGSLALFFGLQSFVSRGKWLGAGDPVLALAIGAALAWPGAAMAVYATYLAVIPLLIVQLIRVRQWRRVRWPFGPLLAFGGTISLFFGTTIWQWLTGSVTR